MGGLVDKALLDQIRSANDIVDVVGSYLPLKKAGANWVTLCPFHREKTPSFNVNPHRQIFHCFGCHKGGDVFRFVQDYENVGFMDAVRRLAERANIPLVLETTPEAAKSRQLRDVLLEMHEQITRRWQNALTQEAGGEGARAYLASRGVTEEAVRHFRLGFAPDAWDDTVNWATGRRYALADVEKAGLIVRKEGSDHYYDRFRGRLIFPISDEQGRVIAFSGRLLTSDAKAAKYVNSPETPIFAKSKVFYGLDKSRRALLDAGFAVVCEGQLDLMACYMAGIQNVVAPQGTAFTNTHAHILKRYVSEAVLCFDSDDAGQNAAIRSLDGLLESGLAIRVATVPAPHDPDSFIRAHGAEAFQRLIDDAPGFFEFLLDRLCRQHGTDSDRGLLAVIRGMAEALAKAGSPVLFDTHAQKTAGRLGITPDAVRQEFRRLQRPESGPRQPIEPEEVPVMERPHPTELWLLKLLLSHPETVPWAQEHVDAAWIRNKLARDVFVALTTMMHGSEWEGVASFVHAFDDPRTQAMITEAAAGGRELPNPLLQLPDVAAKLRNTALDEEMTGLNRRIGDPGLSDAERVAALQRQQEIRNCKQQLLPPVTV